jgi:hypothetical protein
MQQNRYNSSFTPFASRAWLASAEIINVGVIVRAIDRIYLTRIDFTSWISTPEFDRDLSFLNHWDCRGRMTCRDINIESNSTLGQWTRPCTRRVPVSTRMKLQNSAELCGFSTDRDVPGHSADREFYSANLKQLFISCIPWKCIETRETIQCPVKETPIADRIRQDQKRIHACNRPASELLRRAEHQNCID